MKILCLNPPFLTEHGRYSRSSRSPAITKSGTLYYPIWLCYVAAALEEDGHNVSVIDSCAYEMDFKTSLDRIAEIHPELVIIDTSTPSINEDLRMAASIKSLLPGTVCAVMGTHPTALPKETLELEPALDMILMREADFTAREAAQAVARYSSNTAEMLDAFRTIPGLAFRDGKEIILTPPRPLIDDLDVLPFVSKTYHRHLAPEKYFFAASDYPEVQIMTSRGCVARCTFCVYPQTIHGRRYRQRSAESIADEFQWIVENMPEIRQIGIEDDTFTGNQKRVVEFCRLILKRGISIKWYCNTRADLKIETMRWMKRAHCALVTVGYESGNPEILKLIRKGITPEQIESFSKNAKKAKLLVHGCFMAGNRGETRQTLEDSLQLALRLGDDTMQFFPLIVYPGTADFDWAGENGLLTVTNYREYVTENGQHNSVVRMPDMSSDELRKWCDQARKRYYLRTRYIIYKLVRLIRRPSEIRRTFKAAKRFIKYLLQ